MNTMDARVEGRHDHFLIGHDAAATAAAVSLEAITKNRIERATRVAAVIQELRMEAVGLRSEIAALKRQVAQVTFEKSQVDKENRALNERNRNLNLCLVDVLKNVDDHHGGAVSVEQRVEATIQAKDSALESGNELDVISNRMASFLESISRDPSISRHS